MLRYTGHPLVDVGLATIPAFRNKIDPTALSEEDLVGVAEFIERQYGPNLAKLSPGAT